MARHMLDRWRWQMAGHMHVLSCPTYMEDHLGLLEDEIAYGLVPLPQLPKHKQVRALRCRAAAAWLAEWPVCYVCMHSCCVSVCFL